MEQETVPINLQVQQIIEARLDVEKISELLKRLCTHKNVNYPKIIDHTLIALKGIDVCFKQSINMIISLSRAAEISKAKSFMIQNIFKGYEQFWVTNGIIKIDNYPDLSKDERIQALSQFTAVSEFILVDFVRAFLEEEYVENNIKQLNEEIWELMSHGENLRALKTLFVFKIFDRIDKHSFFDQLANSHFNIAESDFIFSKSPELQRDMALKLQKNNPKLCADFLKKYNLNYADYPDMLWELEKNGLNYYLREYPLYCFQLKFKYDPRYLSYFVTHLTSKYPKEAESILKKYNLYDNPIFKKQGFQDWVDEAYRKRDNTIIYKNVLEEHDAFGATELRVLGQPVDCLELIDLKMNQEDIMFIDAIDDKFEFARKSLNESKYVGLDCEFSGGVHKFEGQSLQLVQLATFKNVFVFDFNKVIESDEFKGLLMDLFVQNRDVTIIGCGCKEDMNLINKHIPKGQKMKIIVDIQLQYKVNKTIMGLGKICEQYFGKKFSKFQQCSGWNARPLRLAQLHYAALDARVLLEVMKTEKPTKIQT